jgi:hypothetical protein
MLFSCAVDNFGYDCRRNNREMGEFNKEASDRDY